MLNRVMTATSDPTVPPPMLGAAAAAEIPIAVARSICGNTASRVAVGQ